MTNIDNAVEAVRTHSLNTGDTISETVEKLYPNFTFTDTELHYLAKGGLRTLVSSQLTRPGKLQRSRVYELDVRPATAVEQAITGKAISTIRHNPRVVSKPTSKLLTNVLEQVLLNVALEGANGRRIKMIDFSRLDCQHYNKAQSFVAQGIDRRCKVISNIELRLKAYAVFRVKELPLKEQVAIAREWRNTDKGLEPPDFAIATGA